MNEQTLKLRIGMVTAALVAGVIGYGLGHVVGLEAGRAEQAKIDAAKPPVVKEESLREKCHDLGALMTDDGHCNFVHDFSAPDTDYVNGYRDASNYCLARLKDLHKKFNEYRALVEAQPLREQEPSSFENGNCSGKEMNWPCDPPAPAPKPSKGSEHHPGPTPQQQPMPKWWPGDLAHSRRDNQPAAAPKPQPMTCTDATGSWPARKDGCHIEDAKPQPEVPQ